jgi:hypothetical protein|tara:strand:+ start:191 stop:517 length:327 start_codon:yes stop_codon:yes gene_type:complete
MKNILHTLFILSIIFTSCSETKNIDADSKMLAELQCKEFNLRNFKYSANDPAKEAKFKQAEIDLPKVESEITVLNEKLVEKYNLEELDQITEIAKKEFEACRAEWKAK